MTALQASVSIILLTHNRKHELLRTLCRLTALEERPPIFVVDNASADGSADAVARNFPRVHVIRLDRNLGAAGRNEGVRRAGTPYVAFCDDDTWWAPGSLTRAAALLDAYPKLAVITGRVLVGLAEKEDPTSTRMAASPLENRLGLPGAAVLGFLAGACMMRRSAFLAAGGYHRRFFLGMEECLMAIDLAAAGWSMAYVSDVVIHHHPSAQRNAAGRRRLLVRNAIWCAWLRRPRRSAMQETTRLVREALGDPQSVLGVAEAVLGLPWVLRERHPIPADVEDALCRIAAFYETRSGGTALRSLADLRDSAH